MTELNIKFGPKYLMWEDKKKIFKLLHRHRKRRFRATKKNLKRFEWLYSKNMLVIYLFI